MFPLRRFLRHGRQVILNRLVYDFSLRVALRMSWCRFILVNLQEVANLIKEFVTKLFPSVGENLTWYPVATNPLIDYVFSDCRRFFIWNNSKFNKFGVIISDTKDMSFVPRLNFQRSK